MKTFENEDRNIYKQKTICEFSDTHSKQPALYVCVQQDCLKKALCKTCVDTDHQMHKVELIGDIKYKALDYIDDQGKIQQNQGIMLLDKLEKCIQERYSNMQDEIDRALKNFNNRFHLFKESIKREQLDILYQIEIACERMQAGESVSIELFNKNYNLLNQIEENTTDDGQQPIQNYDKILSSKKVEFIRAELQNMNEKLMKHQQNFSEIINKQTEYINKIFMENKSVDNLDKNNNNNFGQSISIHDDSHNKSMNEDSFDMIDSIQFSLNDISGDQDDGESTNENQDIILSAEAEMTNEINNSAHISSKQQQKRIQKQKRNRNKQNIIVDVDDFSIAHIENPQDYLNHNFYAINQTKQESNQFDKILGKFELLDQIDKECPINYSKYYPEIKYVIQLLLSSTNQYFVFFKNINNINSIRGPYETEESALRYYEQKLEEQRLLITKAVS